MGTYLAAASPLACDAADRRRVSLELSLASFFPLNLGNLRGGSPAIFARFDQAGVTDPLRTHLLEETTSFFEANLK